MAADLAKSRNAGKMRAIQEKSKEQGNGIVAINLDINLITENPDNEKVFNMDGIDKLAEDIERIGLLDPIEVLKKDDGTYEISSGHRRYRAMKKLGKKTIPCTVSAYPETYERGIKLLSSNVWNRKMLPMDWARAIDYYYNLMQEKGGYEGKLRDRASEYFKMAPTNIQRYISLLKLIPELQELVDDPEYPYSAFDGASSLDKEKQKILYDRIVDEIDKNSKRNDTFTGISKARIVQMINDLKGKPEVPGQKDKAVGNFVTNALNGYRENDEKGPKSGADKTISDYKDVTDEVDIPDEFQDTAPATNNIGVPQELDFDEEREIAPAAATKSTNETSASVDSRLSAFTPEIEKIATGKYKVSNTEMVRRYLDRLKKAIKEIERQL